MPNIDDKAPEWAAQERAVKLGRTIMGGTAAMRRAGKNYLPPKRGENAEDYAARLNSSALRNFLKKTIVFYEGQIFQKPVQYHPPANDEPERFDRAWFDGFADDVDLNGNNLSVFAKKVFRAGLVDGVTFILVDHTRASTRENPDNGRLEYFDDGSQRWEPKTAAADERLGLRPYFTQILAEQVLDVWLDVENGRRVLKHFRYQEMIEEAAGGDALSREAVTRIIAWWPDRWEVWSKKNGGAPVKTAEGVNRLGVIPLAWFMAEDDDLPNLTARPPLADLAEENRVLWESDSDHIGRLMPYVRSPGMLARGLTPPTDDKGNPLPLLIGPGQLLLSGDANAAIQPFGVDPSSVQSSQSDLEARQDSMRDYGLQSMAPNITATQSENSAVTANAALKGWAANLQDGLENALKIVALYRGWEDGPALFVNRDFKRGFDVAYLNFVSSAVREGVFKPEELFRVYKSMAPDGDELTEEMVLNPDYGKEPAGSEIFPSLSSLKPKEKEAAPPTGQKPDGGPLADYGTKPAA